MMESALTSQLERRAKLSGSPNDRTISGEKFNKLCVDVPEDLKRHMKRSALICYELLVNISASSSRSSRGEVDFFALVCVGVFFFHALWLCCVLQAKDV